MYREQFVVQRDPALLEQIGPRQYRLRVFPIPPVEMQYEANARRSTIEAAAPLYMWLLTAPWRKLAAGRCRNWWLGAMCIGMPTASGSWMGPCRRPSAATWLPATVPGLQPARPSAHRVDLPGGRACWPSQPPQSAARAAGRRAPGGDFDRSRSMAEREPGVQAAFERLRVLPGAQVDVYLTASDLPRRRAGACSTGGLDASGLVFFGGQNAAELLAQFEQLRGPAQYDAILTLTDASGYELGDRAPRRPPRRTLHCGWCTWESGSAGLR